jgi:hypothetical protein
MSSRRVGLQNSDRMQRRYKGYIAPPGEQARPITGFYAGMYSLFNTIDVPLMLYRNAQESTVSNPAVKRSSCPATTCTITATPRRIAAQNAKGNYPRKSSYSFWLETRCP